MRQFVAIGGASNPSIERDRVGQATLVPSHSGAALTPKVATYSAAAPLLFLYAAQRFF
jgi:hypothetical protein